MEKLLLFDLDNTLLKSNKTICQENIVQLENCRKKGFFIGIATARSENNCSVYIKQVNPEVLITSGGALVKCNGEYIHKAFFGEERSKELIDIVRNICGEEVEITMDTIDEHYWNYKKNPSDFDDKWEGSIWTDYSDFSSEVLKMCVEIYDKSIADRLAEKLTDCNIEKFSDAPWYKYTKKGVTKENAINLVCKHLNILPKDIIAFGDDFGDVGMLKMAGTGVAMGNAIKEVKEIADVVIGDNDKDSIAIYLKKLIEV